MSVESEDCMLLERAFLRIGSAESDDQFEALIDKLLGPIIFKVPSTHESVRKKAIELLTHISKRIKCRPQVQVPVKSLLQIYTESSRDQFVKNFLVVYIKLGYHRMPQEKQLDCIPVLIKCIEEQKYSEQLRNTLLNLFIRTCRHFAASEITKQFIQSHNLKTWTSLNLILEVFYDALIMPYSWDDYISNNSVPPGLSNYTFQRIIQEGKIDDFLQVKLGILNFLNSSNICINDKYIHFVIASVDTNAEVAEFGKNQIKNFQGSLEWTESNLRPLYKLFVGDSDKIIENKRKRPADLRMKIILLPFLHRLNTYCWPECIQIVVSCLQEDTNAKMKISGLNFGLSALLKAEVNSFKEVAPNFLNVLTEILWKQETDDVVRTLIYRLTGNVISLNPELVKYHKEVFPKFIEDLTEETIPDVRNTIKESLLKMVYAFKQTEEPEMLMHFLVNRITSPEPSVKHIVLHYLHKVFPPDDLKSRFLLVWSTVDSDSSVRKEAEDLLTSDLKVSKINNSSESVRRRFPEFKEMLYFVFSGCVSRVHTLMTNFALGDQNLPLSNNAFVKLLLYIRNCMLYDCYSPLCYAKFEHPCAFSPKIGQYLRGLFVTEKNVLEHYLDLIMLIFTTTNQIEPLTCLLECVGTVPDIFAANYYDELPNFQKILFNSNDNVSIVVATLIGIIITYGCRRNSDIENKLQGFKTHLDAKNSGHAQIQSSLWCIASIAERGGFKKISEVPLYIIEAVMELLNHSSIAVVTAACHCIGQIVRRNDLPLPNRNLKIPLKYGGFDGLRLINETNNDKSIDAVDGNTDKIIAEEQHNPLTKLKIVEKLLDLTVEKKVAHKVKMKAAEALGFFCIGEEDFPYRKLIINTIIEKENDCKEIGVLLDLADVMSDCILGSYSVRIIDLWTQKEAEYKLPKGWNHERAYELFLFAVNKISNELVSNEKCKSKMAAAVWLLVFMKRCLKIPLELNELSRIQYTFLELMSQSDEIIHDAATRGLSFIARFADEEMTTILAKQLTEKICLVHKGTSEMGTVLGMYKEFCYLVSSLKNHSLIYHFLNLLNHQNQKSDEKYASTFKDHEEVSVGELVPYYPQIIPSLYVYRFHQSVKIKNAMNTIWNTLFSDNVKAVQSYSRIILQKSVPELTCANYELRIAHCFALEDLLRIEGNKFVSENKHVMAALLSNLYKLMDDVYESVRRVAYGTTKMYLQAFVQNINREKRSDVSENELLNEIFPTLLNVGIASAVTDIRKISVQTLLDIIDHLGSLIKSHLHYLIPLMIENASEIETCIRYTDQQGNELIENVKEEFVSAHFSTEIVKRCMKFIDEEVIEKLLPRLLELLKDNISFTTRTAAINFVVLLATNMDIKKLQPFVGKLLGALFTGLSNSHKNVRKNSANAIGTLCKAAKDSSIDNLLTKLMQLYIKNFQDENINSSVGQTLLSVASQCQEAVQARSEKIVPVIFFAIHLKKAADGSNDAFIELWNDVWNDVIGSMEVALSKHQIAIIQFLRQSFHSPSWNTKTQAARALSKFVNKCPEDLQSNEELKLFIQDIIVTLNGKFWHGKEELLDTVACLCTSTRIVDKNSHSQILEAVLKECGRGNIAYQTAALEALGKILASSIYEHNYFDRIYNNLKTIILKNDDDGNSSEYMESEDSSVLMNQQIKLKETAYSVLGKAWPDNAGLQMLYQDEVIDMLVDRLFKSTRLSQVSIMVALKNVLSKLRIIKNSNYIPEEQISLDNIMNNVERALRYALELKKHTLLKKEALHIMINLMEQFKETSNTNCLQQIKAVFTNHVHELSKDADPIIVLQNSQLKDLLKSCEK